MSNIEEGDVIISLTSLRDFTKGKEYTVVCFDDEGDPYVIDDTGEQNYLLEEQWELKSHTTQTDDHVEALFKALELCHGKGVKKSGINDAVDMFFYAIEG